MTHARFSIPTEIALAEGEALEHIAATESDTQLIQHVVDYLSFGLGNLSEDIVLRLHHARDAALKRKRL